MTNINLHPRSPVKATIERCNGHEWITVAVGEVELTIFARGPATDIDADDKRPTLQQIAEALSGPLDQLNFEAQVTQHDIDESNRMPMPAWDEQYTF